MNTVTPSKFDINKLTFEPLKNIPAQKNDLAGTDKKQIFMKYSGGPLLLQTPISVTPFGISRPFGDKTGEKEWIIDMDLDKISASGIDGAENLPDIATLGYKLTEFKNVLRSIDDKCCEHISKIFKDLWPAKKVKTKEGVQEDVYESLVKINKHPEKGEYPDKFRAKFSRPYLNKDKKKSFVIFDRFGKEIHWYNDSCQSPTEASFNTKRMLVQGIVQCSGLWIINEKVYCSFKVVQLRVWKQCEISGFGFVLEDGETVPSVKDKEEEEDKKSIEKSVEDKEERGKDDMEDESDYTGED